MKNYDTIGNRTRDLPACSAVPQPTAPPRFNNFNNYNILILLRTYVIYIYPSICFKTNCETEDNLRYVETCSKSKGKVHPRTGHEGPEGE